MSFSEYSRKTFKPLLALALSLVFAAVSAPAGAEDPAVTGVRLGENPPKSDKGTVRVVLDLTKPVPYSAFLLENPYRLVIDLPELDWSVNGSPKGPVGIVEGMRYGLFRPGNSRVVVDLAGPARIARHNVLSSPDRVMFDLSPVPKSKFAAGTSVSLSNWKPPTASPVPVPRARPAGDSRRVVVIDPGHGGVDPGAVRGKTYEKRITAAVAEEVRRQLEATKRYRVVLTRNRDIFLELRERVEVAHDNSGEVFISLHADTHPKRATRGASVYTLSERASDREAARLAEKENKADIISGFDLSGYSSETGEILLELRQRHTMEESAVFANMLIRQFQRNKVNVLQKTHRFAGFAVLKSPDVPSVLVELGYLSNTADRKMLLSSTFRKNVGRAVLAALDEYFKRRDDLASR